MKAILLLCFVTASFSAFSQKDFQVTGRWHVISIANEDISISFKNDSLAFSGSMKEKYEASPELKATMAEYISYFKTMYFDFFEKGFFTMKHDGKLIDEGTYTVDRNKKTIALSTVNSNGIRTRELATYQQGKLGTTITMDYDDGGMTVILAK